MGSEHSYLREITLPYPRERKELLLGREKFLLIHDLVLEGDSLVIVNVLKEASPPPALVPAMPYNVNSISHEFRSVEFSRICRQGNRPAHLLAKQACGIADLSIWIEENSYFLEQVLLYDVNVAFHSQ